MWPQLRGYCAVDGAPLLLVEGLRVRLGGVEVLHGVTLREEGPGYLVVVGPSGSGKTTLLRGVAGLVEPSGGRVVVAGRDVTLLPPWERGVAMVQQSPGLLPHLSVLENVALAAELRRGLGRGEARRLAEELLGELGLGGLEGRRPGELSGGQLQRAAIAVALATGAPLLLLDEPLSHLDRLTSERLRGLLRRVQRENRLLAVHVTHDLDEALVLADRLAVLIEGSLAAYGDADEVYRCPRSLEAARLLGHGAAPARLLGLGGEGLVTLAPDYVGLRPGGDWVVESVERERGRLRVTVAKQGYRLHAYIHPSEAQGLGPGARARPVLLGEPCLPQA